VNGGTGRRLRWLAVVAIVAGLAAVPSLVHRARGRAVSVYAVSRAELVQTVVATGRISTLARVEIGSLVAGTVTAVTVREGDRVAKGQLLVRLRDDAERAALAQARAGLAQAEASASHAEAGLAAAEARLLQLTGTAAPAADQSVRAAEADLEAARSSHERVSGLAGKGMLPRADLDEARRALETAGARVARERTLAEGSRPGGGEHRALEAAVAQARAALAQAGSSVAQARAGVAAAEVRLADTAVAAPAEGTIVARAVEEGDTVQPGRVLLALSRPGRTEIVAPVDEKNLALLLPGQRAAVSADAYPDRSFRAELATLVPAVAAASGTITARFSVADPPAYLLPDMTVSVETEVARKGGALALPVDAVRDLAGSPWVLAVRGGRAARVPVQVGVRGVNRVEILSGLAEGDLVVPVTDGRAAEGEKVRVAARLPG
jgi:HlyD family secretion protein